MSGLVLAIQFSRLDFPFLSVWKATESILLAKATSAGLLLLSLRIRRCGACQSKGEEMPHLEDGIE